MTLSRPMNWWVYTYKSVSETYLIFLVWNCRPIIELKLLLKLKNYTNFTSLNN